MMKKRLLALLLVAFLLGAVQAAAQVVGNTADTKEDNLLSHTLPARTLDSNGAKVPAAMSRLNQALADASGRDPAKASTEDLVTLMGSLQAARMAFNAIDHAYKGSLTVNGKPVATGLSMKAVQPALETLNLAQLRIQDELERRGVAGVAIPGRQAPLDWLDFIAPDLYNSVRGVDPAALRNYARDPAYYVDRGERAFATDDPTLAMVRELDAVKAGGIEAALRALVARRPQLSNLAARLLRAFSTEPAGLYDYMNAGNLGGGG